MDCVLLLYFCFIFLIFIYLFRLFFFSKGLFFLLLLFCYFFFFYLYEYKNLTLVRAIYLRRIISTPRRFPSYLTLTLFLYFLLPSPVHPTGFSFCFFPGFLAIYILLSSNNNNYRVVIFMLI